jgi:hypothetical protein
VYSPKIREELIPSIYKLAHHLGIPMTKLVNMVLQGVIEDLVANGTFRYIDDERRDIEEAAHKVIKMIRSKSREDRQRALEALEAIGGER